MKTVKQPGGATAIESAIIGAERQLRVDTARGTLRIHDGVTPGGFELPNISIVQALLTGNTESGQTVDLQYCATEAVLKDLIPTPTMVAIVNEAGIEDIYTWKGTVDDGGGVSSNVSGWWHRLDSAAGFYVRLFRAGVINLQIDGIEPAADQDITAWINNNVAKLYDGADYLTATPVLFARLISKIGSYASSIIFPDRLADILVEAADLDVVTDTGWYKSKTSDAHAPSTTVSPVYHTKIDVNTMSQVFEVQGSATRDRYIRFKAAGTWGSWVQVSGTLDARLGAVSSLQTDANSCIDSGFYHLTSAASNIPAAANGTLISNRYSSTDATQTWSPLTGDQLWFRRFASSAWQAWVRIDLTATALNTVLAAYAAKATPVLADSSIVLDSAASNVPKLSTWTQIMAAFSASAANVWANANSLWLTVANLWASLAEVTLTDAATIAVDMGTFLNGKVTLAGNRTLGQPSNAAKIGQTGRIRIIQDATGSRTLAYHADWKFAGGTAPVLTTTASREDVLYYEILAANRIFGSLNKDVR